MVSLSSSSTREIGENAFILSCLFQFFQPQCLFFEGNCCPHIVPLSFGEEENNQHIYFKNNKSSLEAMMMNSVSGESHSLWWIDGFNGM